MYGYWMLLSDIYRWVLHLNYIKMSICIKKYKQNSFNKRIYEKLQNSGESPNEIMHHFKIKNVSRLANDHLNIISL